MTTRRQHYVWKKYLQPWTKDGQVWCLRNESGAAFRTNTINVAVKKDFYKLTDLTPADVNFIDALAIKPIKQPLLKDLNQGWVRMFNLLFRMVRFIKGHQKTSLNVLKELENLLINLEEETHSRQETAADKYLRALVAGDSAFYDTDEGATEFSFFLAQQYFRTKAMQDRMRAQFANTPQIDSFERCWPVLRYIFATNVGFSIYANRKTMKLQLMQGDPETHFIAGDQPIINTYGAFVPLQTQVEETEFYYPVSPHRAILISGHPANQNVEGSTLSPYMTRHYNLLIERCAHEQLFALKEESLKDIQRPFGKEAV